MNLTLQLRSWLLALLLSVLLVYLLSPILLPFVAGMAIAYVLDPFVDRVERWRVPRWLATTIVLVLFVLLLISALILVVPIIQDQVAALINALPSYEEMRQKVMPTLDRMLGEVTHQDFRNLATRVGEHAAQAASWASSLVGSIWSGGLALFNVLSLLVITPVVAFYLLRDWDRMVARMDQLLPRDQAETIRQAFREIDDSLAGFVRGQSLVCLFLGTFYGVGLTLVGLDFGLLIGLIAGVLSFIPYVGSIVGFVSSVGVALVQYDNYYMVALVAGIFFLGQFVEGNFLTPKVVGDRIGLHPVWVIFALLAGGALFGLVGVLLAVPAAAALAVLIRLAIRAYLESPSYRGSSSPPQA
jgi:predicted PurR-regulated permease PerM